MNTNQVKTVSAMAVALLIATPVFGEDNAIVPLTTAPPVTSMPTNQSQTDAMFTAEGQLRAQEQSRVRDAMFGRQATLDNNPAEQLPFFDALGRAWTQDGLSGVLSLLGGPFAAVAALALVGFGAFYVFRRRQQQ